MWNTLMICCGLMSLAQCQDFRLPDRVAPMHYDLKLLYDIDPMSNFSFFGVVDIQLTAKRPTYQIVLNAAELSVHSDGIKLVGRREGPTVANVYSNNSLNFLTIELTGELKVNRTYTLTVPFYGNLKSALSGAYISSYVDESTNFRHYLVATNFKAIAARKAFPCFDEPIYKSTFKLAIGHGEYFSAISNMPVSFTSRDNLLEEYWPWHIIRLKLKKNKESFVWEQFVPSVPMSTYLVAFVISNFTYIESPVGLSDTHFKIWAQKDATDQTSYASLVGPRILTYYEDSLNMSFPLHKKDIVAIPDFKSDPSENWGLISYRESMLMYDQYQSSLLDKEAIANTLAHELAHQWFGNLVTMKWWSDLWLSEGMATFMAATGVHAVEPLWKVDRLSAVECMLNILHGDSLESSHPVSAPLVELSEVEQIFDFVTYQKGAMIIRMIYMFLGNHVFKKALHNYLVKYSYSNADQDDFWFELTDISREYATLTRNVTVKEVMDTWTTQTGYPLLTVQRDYSDNSLTITQSRFLGGIPLSRTQQSWWVPLRVMSASEAGLWPEPVQWLADNEGVTHGQRYEHSASNLEWVLFNHDMITPCRINYDERNWQLLIEELSGDNFHIVPVLGRVQLITDAFALAWSNRLVYTTALQLVSYLSREHEYLPLLAGIQALARIGDILKRTADFEYYKNWMRDLFQNKFTSTGGLVLDVNVDDMDSIRQQVLLSNLACHINAANCEEKALELFDSWMTNADSPDAINPIPITLRPLVYCTAIAHGGAEHWLFALNAMKGATAATVSRTLLQALACSRDVATLSQFLEWSITEGSEVRRQDAANVIVSVARNSVGFFVAKEFLFEKVEDVYRTFHSHGLGADLGKVYGAIIMQFTTKRELEQFIVWRDRNSKYLKEGRMSINRAVEVARENIMWMTRNRRVVVDALTMSGKEKEKLYHHVKRMAVTGPTSSGTAHKHNWYLLLALCPLLFNKVIATMKLSGVCFSISSS